LFQELKKERFLKSNTEFCFGLLHTPFLLAFIFTKTHLFVERNANFKLDLQDELKARIIITWGLASRS
jgi:hypothetical protein